MTMLQINVPVMFLQYFTAICEIVLFPNYCALNEYEFIAISYMLVLPLYSDMFSMFIFYNFL